MTATSTTPASAAGRRLTRRLAAPLFALGLTIALAACNAMGPGASPSETAGESAATTVPPATANATGDTTNECADVQQTIAAIETRLAGLGDKVPGDIPGAISDVQASVDDLTALNESLGEGQVKTHVSNIITLGNEAITILEQAQSGELSPLEAISQGTGKIAEVQAELEALSTYCQWA